MLENVERLWSIWQPLLFCHSNLCDSDCLHIACEHLYFVHLLQTYFTHVFYFHLPPFPLASFRRQDKILTLSFSKTKVKKKTIKDTALSSLVT